MNQLTRLAALERQAQVRTSLPASAAGMNCGEWLRTYFAGYISQPMGERQVALWQWLESLEPGVRPRPRIEVWPRASGKSTTVELGVARIGATGKRRFVLYVSLTQAQADRHVQSVATMLERLGIARATNEYGASKGWRREELRTATGFTVVAYGLDSALRGLKVDQFRPDLIVMDDVDARHDSPQTRQKKVEVLTTSILPAGSFDAAVLVIQNLVTRDSIVAQLADGRADFLHDRELPTVEPAVVGLAVEHTITATGASYRIMAGTPTWAGQDIATCERQINAWGLAAFLREAQHEVDEVAGGLWQMERDIEPFRVTRQPELTRIAVAIDPSISETGDEAGIIVAGVAANGHSYVLADASVQGSPRTWAEAAVAAYYVHGAGTLYAESNQGGQMIQTTVGTVPGAPPVTLIHASEGKQTRAEPVVALYEAGRVHHVGRFPQLERELCSWHPGMASPNRLDALVHVLTALQLQPAKTRWRVIG